MLIVFRTHCPSPVGVGKSRTAALLPNSMIYLKEFEYTAVKWNAVNVIVTKRNDIAIPVMRLWLLLHWHCFWLLYSEFPSKSETVSNINKYNYKVKRTHTSTLTQFQEKFNNILSEGHLKIKEADYMNP